ncbi:MAG: 50S ribosomal protein L3 [Myxococcaceae bacterium]|nr:50S ribosomal protein L3 [Myxococcaceae bacterium]MBH2005807.1 50S ribosomal protein L3 [Myxococcaceae bacterium]
MTIGLMATKVGMTQVFLEDGVRVPVTVLKIEPNHVVSKKIIAKDGYTALQLGVGSIRDSLLNKPKKGHLAKANLGALRHLCEFRVDQTTLDSYELGATIGLELFDQVSSVDIAGTSKGKGFAGVMKRHNFSGFPRTHGTHEYFRHGGSIGMRSKPGKVLKGKRMAGHMGDETITTQNLRVIRTLAEDNLLLVRGAVPGAKGKIVNVFASTHKPKALPGVAGHVVEEGSKNPMKASKAGAKGKPAAKKK